VGRKRGEMTQALYAHMNNKTIKIKKKKDVFFQHTGLNIKNNAYFNT
jgi:hypothetical protein